MKMRTDILGFTLLAASVAVGCTKTEVQPRGWMSDPDAVIVEAGVGTATKSNPLGSGAEQNVFNIGDNVTVKQSGAGKSVVYSFDGSAWAPVGSDYLVWSAAGKSFEAWYPSQDPSFVTDQSTLEGIAEADVMFAGRTYTEIPSDRRIALNFTRKRALVTVKIVGYNDEFDPATDKITDVRLYLTDASERADQAVKPYVCDASGAGQASDVAGAVGFSYSAVGLRAEGSDSNLFIEFKVGEKTLTVKGCPVLEAGKAYTFNLTVGKDRIELGDVSVGDWTPDSDRELDAELDGDLWDGSVASSFESGSGTETDPYIIATSAQLAYLAQSVNGGNSYSGVYFRLGSNICLDNLPWTPIGDSNLNPFSGNFDGDGKGVYGLNVNSSRQFVGLFGVTDGASIKNCHVRGRIEASSSVAGGIVGGIAGMTTVAGCTAKVTVIGAEYVGGLVGYVEAGSSISDCSVKDCMVDGYTYAGGLIGYILASDVRIINCSVSGVVKGVVECAGLVCCIDFYDNISISACTANVDLILDSKKNSMGSSVCGGLAGELSDNNSTWMNCGFNGSITTTGYGFDCMGAAVGLDRSKATFIGCWYNADKTGGLPAIGYSTGDADGKDYPGIEGRHLVD